jgi:hypothetical protein
MRFSSAIYDSHLKILPIGTITLRNLALYINCSRNCSRSYEGLFPIHLCKCIDEACLKLHSRFPDDGVFWDVAHTSDRVQFAFLKTPAFVRRRKIWQEEMLCVPNCDKIHWRGGTVHTVFTLGNMGEGIAVITLVYI